MDFSLKPVEVELIGKLVRVSPMDLNQDIEDLFQFTCGKSFQFKGKTIEDYDSIKAIWDFMFLGPFESAEEMKQFYKEFCNVQNARVFTIYDLETNLSIGSLSYIENSPKDLKVEIGVVWMSPAVQRTGACTEAVYLLMNNAFELGYRRVEWKCCTDNIRSISFANKIGFKLEIQASEWCITKNRISGALYFAMFRDDWIDNFREYVRKLIYNSTQ